MAESIFTVTAKTSPGLPKGEEGLPELSVCRPSPPSEGQGEVIAMTIAISIFFIKAIIIITAAKVWK
jgi:hypothetical protein